jgi:hypothetical protein
MSLFEPITLACPSCQASVPFQAVASVNADRRPDLRQAVIDGGFQREPCPKCGHSFRLAPEMNYLDAARGQWIAVYPIERLDEWHELEADSLSIFSRAYGGEAPAAARAIGESLQARVVFGWAAFREKLVLRDLDLDDVTLELTKIAMIRGMEKTPFAPNTELRLLTMDDEETLTMAWIDAKSENLEEMLGVPRDLYDEIKADAAGWKVLREALTGVPFVDAQRLMME